MEYTVISGTEMNVFADCARHVGYRWLDVGGTDERESIRTIHAALDKGINLIGHGASLRFRGFRRNRREGN